MIYIDFNPSSNFYSYILKYNYYRNNKNINEAEFIFNKKRINESDYKDLTNEHILMINLYENYFPQVNRLTYQPDLNLYETNESILFNKLNEGLIKSYNYYDVVKYFEFHTKIKILEYGIILKKSYAYNNIECDTLIIYITINKDDYNEDIINHYMKVCGYFISIVQDDKFIDNAIYLQIEPLYIVELTSNINKDNKLDLIYDKDNPTIKNKCNGILYHITLSKYYDKIKDNGLIPKVGKKNKRDIKYPERLYFFPLNLITPNLYFFKETALRLYKGLNEELEIVILKIDLYKYPMIKYKIYLDHNHPLGVFTYEPIHPKCVELYKTFTIKNNL